MEPKSNCPFPDWTKIAVPTLETLGEVIEELKIKEHQMVISEQHSAEIHLLKRRIKFLEILDDLTSQDVDPKDAAETLKEFEKVKRPNDLIDQIIEIYGTDLT